MIYFTGDLHGDYDRFKSKELKKLKKGDTLIVCGDFGFLWDGSKKEQSILKKIEKLKYQVLFLEGTHDNLDLIAQYPLEEWNGGKVRRISKSVLKLERGSVFTIEGKRLFVFGGGESPEMDRSDACAPVSIGAVPLLSSISLSSLDGPKVSFSILFLSCSISSCLCR